VVVPIFEAACPGRWGEIQLIPSRLASTRASILPCPAPFRLLSLLEEKGPNSAHTRRVDLITPSRDAGW
jgi:hypothetical protein